MAVDPGQKNIGIAVSDPQGMLASPHSILAHRSRQADAQSILAIAEQTQSGLIVIGQALDADNNPTLSSRRSSRLAAEIRKIASIPVVLWDETGTTKAARQTRRQMGASKSKRAGHLDDVAAALILQSFLDQQKTQPNLLETKPYPPVK